MREINAHIKRSEVKWDENKVKLVLKKDAKCISAAANLLYLAKLEGEEVRGEKHPNKCLKLVFTQLCAVLIV